MKKIILNIVKQGWPYVLAFYFANKLTEAFVIIRSEDILVKLQNLEHALPVAFSNPLPSTRRQALIGGLVGVFAVFFVIQSARDKKKKFRDGIEHGSAKWGTPEELEPLVDPDFSKNIILSETERLRMTSIWYWTVKRAGSRYDTVFSFFSDDYSHDLVNMVIVLDLGAVRAAPLLFRRESGKM